MDRILFMEQYFYLKEHFVMDYIVHHPLYIVTNFTQTSFIGKGRYKV